MTVYPTLIAPLFNKYTKLEDGEVMTAIEALAKNVSFPLTQVTSLNHFICTKFLAYIHPPHIHAYIHTYIHTFKGLSS